MLPPGPTLGPGWPVVRAYSAIEPQVKLATVPVIALAASEAMKTAVFATSSSVGSRPNMVAPSI